MATKKTADKTKHTTKAAHSEASHETKATHTAKAAHSETTHTRTTRSARRAPAAKTVDRSYTVISNEPEDMAVLSETQEAAIFDMSASENPASDSQAARDARVQAALEPLGTSAALEPIITEDGVILPNSR